MAARSFASDLKVSGTRSRESRFATEAAATTSLDRSKHERGDSLTYIAQVKGFGGTIRFSDRLKRPQQEDRVSGERWTAFVTVLGRDTVGVGATKDDAVGDAVFQLPAFLAKHFR